MLSPRPPLPAISASPPSVSTSSPISVLVTSTTTTSALYQDCRSTREDEFICQVAEESSSSLMQSIDPSMETIGFLSNGTMSKTVLSCDTSNGPEAGPECVQCVEVFPDTMNHCVPDWDAAGRDMEATWELTDIFTPSKGKWDSGHSRKSDAGFVPEHDFEELCWEDGQLLVVIQGLNGKGNSKSRSSWPKSVGEMASSTSGIQSTAIDSTYDTVGITELMDISTMNMHSQEDELLSWLQHPPEDQVDKLAAPNDTVNTDTPVGNGEIMLPNDLTRCNIWHSRAFGKGLGNRSVSKNVRNETPVTFPIKTSNKLGQDNCGAYQQIELNTVPACSPISTTSMTSKVPCAPDLMATRLSSLSTETQLAASCSSQLQNGSPMAMNFSNFARPALTFKANLHSLGMVNGPSGAERLKQLDRVIVDAAKLRSSGSTTKNLRFIAPRRDGVPLTASTTTQSIGGSSVHISGQTVSLLRRSDQDSSAVGAGISCSANEVQSVDLNTSLMGSTMIGVEGSTEVLEVTELSDLSSSGGSEDSDDTGKKRGPSVGKKNHAEEDLEIQSKALQKEAKGGKKHAMAGLNSSKKSRAAENHNQSERRRRDRISEKMKALQALVPNSYKTDKASMLEEAITYIKALKAQIQMMSSRSGMYFPPVLMQQGTHSVFMQQGTQPVQIAAWPQMGMGMNMGMGMFDMSMPMAAAAPRQFLQMLPFPSAVTPAVQTGASAALDAANLVRGVTSHVAALPRPQAMMRGRLGAPYAGTHNSSPTINAASPKLTSASQQQPMQVQTVQWRG